MVMLHGSKKGVFMSHILLSSVQILSGVWVKGTLYSHLFFKFLEAAATDGHINYVLGKVGYIN